MGRLGLGKKRTGKLLKEDEHLGTQKGEHLGTQEDE